ncbi:MAG: Selenate reductase subunit gamma [Steroidobacteraceae bacterium]|nr:Selenate reductase subunit gamma [Steroidobacteraceae bacterium]
MLAKRVDVGADALGDPGASMWERFPARKVALVPTPVGMQPSKYIMAKWRDGEFGHTSAAGLQAAHNGQELAFRLEWECQKSVTTINDNDQFADAAALLFPLTEDAPLIMGMEGAPVNIWYWRADQPKMGLNNVADGIGTSRLTSSPLITTQGAHADGRWSLVFRRALAAAADAPTTGNVAKFEPGKDYRLAVALWSGANSERAGLKAYSPVWVELSLEG